MLTRTGSSARAARERGCASAPRRAAIAIAIAVTTATTGLTRVAHAEDLPAPVPVGPASPASASPASPAAVPPLAPLPPPAPRESPPTSPLVTVPPPPPPLPESALAPLELDPERRPVKHRYRKGFLFTLVNGGAIGSGSGYPNDVKKIGVPEHFTHSGTMVGSTFQMFIGGALTDYLSFGVLFGGASFKSENWEVSSGGFGVRTDVFPLVLALPKIPELAHLGLGFDLGAGSVKVQAKGNYGTVEGFQSAIGVGLFYETKLFSLLGGHVSLSPELAYHTTYSEASQVNYGSMTARLSFYGGP